MKCGTICGPAIALSILLAADAPSIAAPVERSVSTSRQFIVYGTDTRTRGAISELAERTKANLLGVLRQPDRWATPVLINLRVPQPTRPELPSAAFRVSQTGFGLKLQLDLMLASELDTGAIERELARAVLVEMIYRAQPNVAAGSILAQPPDWLVDGLLAAAPGRDRRPLIDALASAGEPLSLPQFLEQRPALLDSPARTLYQAYSLALVQWLLSSDNGPAQLARYIADLTRAPNDALADLQAHFPSLREGNDKLWQAAIAGARTSDGPGLLTFAESERRLSQLLADLVKPIEPGAPEFKLAELAQKKRLSPVEKARLVEFRQGVLSLVGNANPALRPIAEQYEQAAQLLVRGKRRGVARRLAEVESTRAQLAGRMHDVDDYMNWFEATQAKAPSGVFVDYLRTATARNQSEPRRRDPLSVYLDALEQQTGK